MVPPVKNTYYKVLLFALYHKNFLPNFINFWCISDIEIKITINLQHQK